MALYELSICIVSYNTRQMLADCLASIYQNAPDLSFEILIVDNHSEDGSVEMVRDRYPQAEVVAVLGENRGYTAPMNIALRAASGRYVMQLNPDTLVYPGTLQSLWDFMQTHPEAGVCSPKVLNRDGTLQRQCRRSAARPWDVLTYFSGLSKLFPKSKVFGGYLMTYCDEDETHEAEAVSGSCMLIRKAVLDQVGYLDELYFAYQEDADFCFKVRQAGWKIFYYPAAKITHYGGMGGSRVQPYQGIIAWHRSYYLYYRKNLARDYIFPVTWLFYAGMAVKLGLTLLVNFFRQEKIVGTRKP